MSRRVILGVVAISALLATPIWLSSTAGGATPGTRPGRRSVLSRPTTTSRPRFGRSPPAAPLPRSGDEVENEIPRVVRVPGGPDGALQHSLNCTPVPGMPTPLHQLRGSAEHRQREPRLPARYERRRRPEQLRPGRQPDVHDLQQDRGEAARAVSDEHDLERVRRPLPDPQRRRPVVLYDQLADRWLISQFAITSTTSHQCIAISQTGDPTGAWFRYDFPYSNDAAERLPEVRRLARRVLHVREPVHPVDEHVQRRRRRRLRAGADAAGPVRARGLHRPRRELGDVDLLGPAAGRRRRLDAAAGRRAEPLPDDPGHDARAIPPTGCSSGTSTSTGRRRRTRPSRRRPSLPVAAFNANMCNFARNCIAQPGTTAKLDAISDRLMFRNAYRNFGDLRSRGRQPHRQRRRRTRAAMRWYEVRNTSTSPTLFQQGTYAGDSANTQSRWMGSAALDANGDIAVGYSDSSSSRPSVDPVRRAARRRPARHRCRRARRR